MLCSPLAVVVVVVRRACDDVREWCYHHNPAEKARGGDSQMLRALGMATGDRDSGKSRRTHTWRESFLAARIDPPFLFSPSKCDVRSSTFQTRLSAQHLRLHRVPRHDNKKFGSTFTTFCIPFSSMIVSRDWMYRYLTFMSFHNFCLQTQVEL